MQILEILTLRGPNFWSRRTVIEALVDIGELRDTPSSAVAGLYERLSGWLPSLVEHRCGVGEHGGFLLRLREGTYAAHILEHVTLELQGLAGTPVGFGKARETSKPGVYKVAVRYKNEEVGRACLLAARDIVMAAFHDLPVDIAATVARLHELADDKCLGPSTGAIVDAAELRGIPAMRLTTGSLVQLGYGVRQRRIWTAEADSQGVIAESLASDKDMTRRLLRECGVPAPAGRTVRSPADAWTAAQEIRPPVVVKPLDANHGRAVFTNLFAQADIEAAYDVAAVEGTAVIVERFIPGNEHRLLVVGDRMVAAACGEAAWIVGDGRSTLEELIQSQINSDPRRGWSDEFPLNFIELDHVVYAEMRRQGFEPGSVPRRGVRILVQRHGNVANDVTDQVHPETAACVVQAARVLGLDIAGVDLVAEDISKPLGPQGGAIVEVNAGPALHMHLKPASGAKQPVGEAIAEYLFPSGADGRIPIACVAGSGMRSRVAQLLAAMLGSRFAHIGLASSAGSFLDGRRLEDGNRADAPTARKLLMNPTLEVGVFEADPLSIVREGLGFDRCEVAVVTDLGPEPALQPHGFVTPQEIAAVQRSPVDVVLPGGTAVLNSDDPLIAAMAELSAGSVVFFGLSPDQAVLAAHRAGGGRAVSVCNGKVALLEGATATPLVALAALPQSSEAAAIEAVLAATAAAWSLGVLPNDLAACLLKVHSPGHEGAGV